MDQLIQLLDGIKLPFELPVLLHPPIVHFAVALPIIALLLEIANLILKRRYIGVISASLLTLAAFIYIAAFFTGKTDGSETFALLPADGKAELKEHKALGIYLVYGIWIVLVLKLIFSAIQRFWAKALFTLILAGFVAAVLVQGKHGGELVYKYGANVQRVSDMDDKIMDLEDEVDTLKEKCAKLSAAQAKQSQEQSKQETQNASAPSTPSAPATQTSKQESNATQINSEVETNETNNTNIQNEIEKKASQVLDTIKKKVKEQINQKLETNASE